MAQTKGLNRFYKSAEKAGTSGKSKKKARVRAKKTAKKGSANQQKPKEFRDFTRSFLSDHGLNKVAQINGRDKCLILDKGGKEIRWAESGKMGTEGCDFSKVLAFYQRNNKSVKFASGADRVRTYADLRTKKPSQYKGKVFAVTDTGKSYQSDGSYWRLRK